MRYCLSGLCAVLACTFMGGCTSIQPIVTQFGEMRAVMREGHTEARISLADAVARPHAIAVGALEGLGGEVTIVDGDVWVARVGEAGIQMTGPNPVDGDQASLLTLAHVDQWRTCTIETATQGSDLEALIKRMALENGIDATMPFPFVIEGRSADMNIHVINGYCPVATDPATVDAQPWRWASSQPVDVVIVGFFAPNAAGVMTHHGTAVHAHAVLSTGGKTITGHVDQVSVTRGMILRVPVV